MADETKEQSAARINNFTYHKPSSSLQIEHYAELRLKAKNFSLYLNTNCPKSRELSLAQTKLEEAVMWANAAIARNE